jgi:hypothetical protein
MENKKHFVKSKTNIVQIITIAASAISFFLSSEMRDLTCRVLCENPKIINIGLVVMAVVNLLARNFKSNTHLKKAKK